ncbi:hypothetical protein EYF80_006909 [Liparis tanakae]|uniref:Uncharacterized protein n=1 Tax=Liparis tanakae TaxID=230148 RepID=A0A4Z2J076_9TELE|nr:hypothetical protein EYF80_006909 [Liparis tanakae]
MMSEEPTKDSAHEHKTTTCSDKYTTVWFASAIAGLNQLGPSAGEPPPPISPQCSHHLAPLRGAFQFQNFGEGEAACWVC